MLILKTVKGLIHHKAGVPCSAAHCVRRKSTFRNRLWTETPLLTYQVFTYRGVRPVTRVKPVVIIARRNTIEGILHQYHPVLFVPLLQAKLTQYCRRESRSCV